MYNEEMQLYWEIQKQAQRKHSDLENLLVLDVASKVIFDKTVPRLKKEQHIR